MPGRELRGSPLSWGAVTADDEDDAFDRHFPRSIGMKSSIHFTPVAVARRAARMLTPREGMRVLDVGAGAGKFCVVAAQEVPSCTFVGVELRPHLVHMARKVASRLAVDNATFLEGNALDLDWSAYDAFYFYNPFEEQILETGLAPRSHAAVRSSQVPGVRARRAQAASNGTHRHARRHRITRSVRPRRWATTSSSGSRSVRILWSSG